MRNSRKTPTLKQKKFVIDYLKSGNITQSAKSSYNINKDNRMTKEKENYNAYQIGYKNLNNNNVKNYINEVLTNIGLTDVKISQSLQKIIESSLTKASLKKITPADGLRGLEMAFKLKDHFPAERKTIDKREVRLQLESKSITELQSMLDSQAQELIKFKELMNNK